MQPLVISIKMPTRDLEKSPLEQAVTRLAINLAQGRQSLAALQLEPRLDVTFLLSHGADVPEFEGMRMGNYSAQENTLYFEVAVPEAYNHSPLASQYVAAVMDDVLTNASDYFAQIDVSFDAFKWQKTVQPLMHNLQPVKLINH